MHKKEQTKSTNKALVFIQMIEESGTLLDSVSGDGMGL